VTAPDSAPDPVAERRRGFAFLLAMLDGPGPDRDVGGDRIIEMIREAGLAGGWQAVLTMLTSAVHVAADAVGATRDPAELGGPMQGIGDHLIEAVRVAAYALAEAESRTPGAMHRVLNDEAARLLYEASP
jgi:hypothetical protein